MRATALARDYKAMKRTSRKANFRESVALSPGREVWCESPTEVKWWHAYSEALEKGALTPEKMSFRDIFEELVPDGRELVRLFDPRRGPSTVLQEAAGAITSSDFSSITGQVFFSRMMQPLKAEDYPIQGLIPTTQTPLSGEKIPGIAGLGDQAEIVPENHDYPLVGTTQDYIETPETVKRGFIVPVTKEAIFFDKTGQLLKEAGDVGNSLRLNKEKRAIDCLIDENTTAHRYKWRGTTYATYQTTTPWDNVTASNALVDWTDVDNMDQTLNAITDPNTGEPVMVEANYMFVTKSLWHTASRINAANEIQVVSPGYALSGNPIITKSANPVAGKYQVVSTRLWAARLATDTDVFYGNPAAYATYMENWGITVTTAGPDHPDNFRRDIVQQFKCSERGQYAVTEPRVMSKSTVA